VFLVIMIICILGAIHQNKNSRNNKR
jgi:hypothetical protein